MYGRKRVGKTTIISKFIENKPSIFFTAQEANEKVNIELFSEKIFKFFKVPDSMSPFANWNDALNFIAEKAHGQKFILAIDKYPYVAKENKSLKSIFQNIIDHN